jgi:hypothetical protein
MHVCMYVCMHAYTTYTGGQICVTLGLVCVCHCVCLCVLSLSFSFSFSLSLSLSRWQWLFITKRKGNIHWNVRVACVCMHVWLCVCVCVCVYRAFSREGIADIPRYIERPLARATASHRQYTYFILHIPYTFHATYYVWIRLHIHFMLQIAYTLHITYYVYISCYTFNMTLNMLNIDGMLNIDVKDAKYR